MAKVMQKESNWRLAGAVLAGYAVIAFFSVVTDWAVNFFIAELRTAREKPAYYFVIVIVADAIFSTSAGYLCAKIARTAARNATIGLMALGELIGAVSAYASWNDVPHWSSIVLLAIYPPLVWWGSQMRQKLFPVKPVFVKLRTSGA